MTRALIVCWCFLSSLLLCGCSDDTQPVLDSGPVDLRPAGEGKEAGGSDVTRLEARALEARVDLTAAPHLASTHAGWKNALCLSCHGKTAKYSHPTTAYQPTDCVECHGYNGAAHRDHATKTSDCSGCHSTGTHVTAFKVPDDCVTCHFHPGSPDGT